MSEKLFRAMCWITYIINIFALATAMYMCDFGAMVLPIVLIGASVYGIEITSKGKK